MLVLSRQRDETIMIGDEVEVTVVDIRGDKVRLGITAPKEVTVHRKEVYEAIKRENRAAAQVRPEDLDPGAGPRPAGPKLAGGAAGGDPNKPALRPTIRATSPQALRPHRPDRGGAQGQPRRAQPRPGQAGGDQPSAPSAAENGGAAEPSPGEGSDRTGGAD